MAKGERKDYTKEFKLAAVFLMKSGQFKPKEVFEIFGGIDRQTVYRWIQEYDKKGEEAFDSKGVLPSAEVKRLQKENADLKMEVEILKKAAAYFAARKKSE